VNDLASYLLAHPIVLVPLLLLAAMLLFAILKRLVKIGAVLAIAGGLYLLLVRYFGG
jgi:hypothetical protein